LELRSLEGLFLIVGAYEQEILRDAQDDMPFCECKSGRDSDLLSKSLSLPQSSPNNLSFRMKRSGMRNRVPLKRDELTEGNLLKLWSGFGVQKFTKNPRSTDWPGIFFSKWSFLLL